MRPRPLVLSQLLLACLTQATAMADRPADPSDPRVAAFLAGTHAWASAARLVKVPGTARGPELRAGLIVHNDARLAQAQRDGATYFTKNFYDTQPIVFATRDARVAADKLIAARFRVAFLLAGPPTHATKLSALAADPYAQNCLDEMAAAVPDIDLAGLRKLRHPHREALLVAAARSPAHREELARLLDEIIVAITPNPAAKMDPDAFRERMARELGGWLSVLPDADLDLVTSRLVPALRKLWKAEAFAKDVEAFVKRAAGR